ncbi:CBASS cGAMP synthase [Bacterioplanoides sp.]|uniref:CBASS cGAMP synthase n=1 Tax=Bacterioplanoides sp. TaxID=2066072 RepID=UPI003B003EBA
MREQNLNDLFYTGENQEDTFFNKISLTITQKQTLISARQVIRTYLAKHVPTELDRKVKEEGLNLSDFPKPRFFTQGSWAYQTLNAPAKPPKQQADLDDGMYLPLGAVDQEPPSEVAKLLLETVEEQLTVLCKTHPNWKIETSNPNCTRIELNDEMHIDVPLYVIPTEDFKSLETAKNTETAALKYNHQAILDGAYDSLYFSESLGLESISLKGESEYIQYFQEALRQDLDSWDALETDHVLMATQSGWRKSDPRPIKDWVESVVSVKSEQLRRVMRYVKAWRDHMHWPLNDPKSILLMVATEKAFYVKLEDRDDQALFSVLRRMKEIVQGQILLPTDQNEDLAKKLDAPENIRAEVLQKIEAFYDDFQKAYRSDAPGAVALLSKHLGKRIPSGPTSLKRVTLASAAAAAPMATVSAQEPSGRVVQA